MNLPNGGQTPHPQKLEGEGEAENKGCSAAWNARREGENAQMGCITPEPATRPATSTSSLEPWKCDSPARYGDGKTDMIESKASAQIESPRHERLTGTRRQHGAKCRRVVSTATIHVRNLRLRTFIGFNPDERVKQQDVVVNIEIGYQLNPGVFDDHVDDALNYKTITKAVIEHVESGRFLLLEKLVADVLELCCEHDSVHHARVNVDKPHALRFADSVSLTLEFRGDRHEIVTENLQ